MERMPKSAIAQWSVSGNTKVPTIVDWVCPKCDRLVTFQLRWKSPSPEICTTLGRCPGCRDNAVFVAVDAFSKTGEDKPAAAYYIYPPSGRRRPIDDLDAIDQVDPSVLRAYVSALNVFNVNEWNGAAVAARRALEGITKSLVSQTEARKTLAQQVEALPKHVDLAKPILGLADAIRMGGNLGAHFDLEREPDEATTRLMLDLLDNLIEYLFIIPARVEELEKRVAQLSERKQGESTPALLYVDESPSSGVE